MYPTIKEERKCIAYIRLICNNQALKIIKICCSKGTNCASHKVKKLSMREHPASENSFFISRACFHSGESLFHSLSLSLCYILYNSFSLYMYIYLSIYIFLHITYIVCMISVSLCVCQLYDRKS